MHTDAHVDLAIGVLSNAHEAYKETYPNSVNSISTGLSIPRKMLQLSPIPTGIFGSLFASVGYLALLPLLPISLVGGIIGSIGYGIYFSGKSFCRGIAKIFRSRH